MASTPTRAVRFDGYGDESVLHVVEIAMPVPAAGEVVVEVRAAGINPGEMAIRRGYLESQFHTDFPSGEGSDLAGVVTSIGEGVTGFAVGDEVLGFSWTRSSHATHASVPVTQIIPKPSELGWEVAGSLYVAGCTAYAAVRAVDPQRGETVAVSAAAGGVGTIVVQMLRARGVFVIGIASSANAAWLTSHGVTPVEYGDGLADRIRAAAPEGVDAFIDLFGPEYLDLALELGVAPQRIETIISFERAGEIGSRADGSGTASTPEVLTEVAGLVVDGTIQVEIAATYPLDRAADAFRELSAGHTRGKIVLIP